MKRGRKPIAKPVGSLLGDATPKILALSPRAKKIYADLAGKIQKMGHGRTADEHAIAIAAEGIELLEKLQAVVAGLDSLVDADSQPLKIVGELRQHQRSVNQLLGALMLTPRSRSASRLPKSDYVAPEQEPESDDPLVRLLG